MGSETNYRSHFKFSWSIGTSLIGYGLRSIFNGCFPCVSPNSLERRQDCMDKLEKDAERLKKHETKIYENSDEFETQSSSDIEEEIPIEDIENIEDIEDIEGTEKGKQKMVYVVKERNPDSEGLKKNPENTCRTAGTPEATPQHTPPTSRRSPLPSPIPSPLPNHIPSPLPSPLPSHIPSLRASPRDSFPVNPISSSKQGSESPLRIREPVSPMSARSSDSDWVDVSEIDRENDE